MSLEDLPLCEVLPAHRFDVGNLERFLRERIEDLGTELQVRQFQGGASNPTFLLTTQASSGPRRFVLRKKPPGQLLASAHQVEREHRAMDALRDTGVPVPRMRALCEDPGVIGTAFYVMDFLDGRIFRDATLPGLAPQERAAIYDELNHTLAKLHLLDFERLGLEDFGRPGDYFARQLARWTRQYRDAETEEIPAMERLLVELPARLPAERAPAIAHGDYRLGNVMFHPTEPRLIAVLDWELSTLGSPLADLGYNAFMWHSPNPTFGSLLGIDLAAAGIPTEAQYVEAYQRRTGAEIDDWDFYLAFAVFRLAAIMQGGFRRMLQGNSAMGRGPDDAPLVNGTPAMAGLALELLNRGSGRAA